MTLLAPQPAMALAVRLLEARGYAVAARNTRGDSLYLRREEGAPAIRVSNHARTAKQRAKHPDIATSLVIRAPRTAAQVAAMVEAAVRMAGPAQAAAQAAAAP